MTWQRKTLGELCDAGGGIIKTGPFGSQLHESDYVDEGVPVVMPKDIQEGRVETASIAQIDEETAARLNQHALKPGDIVYGRRGDIGRQAIITERERGWLCGTGCLRVTLGQITELNPHFLHYYLRDPEVIAWIGNQAVGATMPNLNTSILRSVPVRFPDLPTQRKIAAILSAYDDLIENNTRRVRVLEEMARALYREWFVEYRFPGHEQAEFVEDEQGRRPKGWERVKVGDHALTQYGLTASTINSPEGTRFLRGMDFNKQSYIDWSEVPASDFTGNDRKYKLKRGDLLLIRMADPGKAGLVEEDVDAVFASYIVRVKLDPDKFTTYYGFYLFLSEEYKGYIDGGSTGTTRKSASASVLTGFNVALPPMSLQLEFQKHVETLRAAMSGLVRRNANLRRTRDLLLPKLVSGELDVSGLQVRGPGLEAEEAGAQEEAVA